MLRFAISSRRSIGDRIAYSLPVRNDNRRPRLVKLVAMCGAADIDDRQPAITVKFDPRTRSNGSAGNLAQGRPAGAGGPHRRCRMIPLTCSSTARRRASKAFNFFTVSTTLARRSMVWFPCLLAVDDPGFRTPR